MICCQHESELILGCNKTDFHPIYPREQNKIIALRLLHLFARCPRQECACRSWFSLVSKVSGCPCCNESGTRYTSSASSAGCSFDFGC